MFVPFSGGKDSTVVSPIIDWLDFDGWLNMLTEGIDFNKAYELGYSRVGCWCCPNNGCWSEFLAKVHMYDKYYKWRECTNYMVNTLEYYNKNAGKFVDSTRDLEFTELQDKFLDYIKPGTRVLDFGCGSGRDTKYFMDKGYRVEAIDGSLEFVKMASEYAQIEVEHMLFQELKEVERYDGIWACSSILHLTSKELADVFEKMANALVSKGIVYTSFKYGTDEIERNGRYFTDMTEEKIKNLLDGVDLFLIVDMWVTSDVRPGREEEKWLNLILRKKS